MSVMDMIMPSVFLRRALLLDAVCSGAMGLLLAIGAAPLGWWFRLPEALLREAGIFLVVFAAALVWMASRQVLPRMVVLAVITGNALWAIDSVLLLLPGWIAPNMLGGVFILVQAVIVGALAELEYVGLRRSPGVAVA
jgi:hypothetical protein